MVRAKYLLKSGVSVVKGNKALWPNVCSVEGVPIYKLPSMNLEGRAGWSR